MDMQDRNRFAPSPPSRLNPQSQAFLSAGIGNYVPSYSNSNSNGKGREDIRSYAPDYGYVNHGRSIPPYQQQYQNSGYQNQNNWSTQNRFNGFNGSANQQSSLKVTGGQGLYFPEDHSSQSPSKLALSPAFSHSPIPSTSSPSTSAPYSTSQSPFPQSKDPQKPISKKSRRRHPRTDGLPPPALAVALTIGYAVRLPKDLARDMQNQGAVILARPVKLKKATALPPPPQAPSPPPSTPTILKSSEPPIAEPASIEPAIPTPVSPPSPSPSASIITASVLSSPIASIVSLPPNSVSSVKSPPASVSETTPPPPTLSTELTTSSAASSVIEERTPSPPMPITPLTPKVLTKSWASLLKSPAGSSPTSLSPNGASGSNGFMMNGHFDGKKPLSELLVGVEYEFRAPKISPRGLVNNGNLCFANTILQCLVFSGPFWNLITLIKKFTVGDLKSKTPTVDAMILFLEEFTKSDGTLASSKAINNITSAFPSLSTELTTTLSTNSNASDWSEPFLPEEIYESLKNNNRFDALTTGHQEDAEEFLGFFLDTLHEEILIILDRSEAAIIAKSGIVSVSVNTPSGDGGDDDWLEVGSKGRVATTRTTETRESPITKIFGGQLRSVLKCPSQKDSITLEPYQRLQLDIQPDNVKTIEDALLNLTHPEPLPDFISKTGLRVEATKQVFLETFPPIVILHLKRFFYDNVGGVGKSCKVIGYDLELTMNERIIAPAMRNGKKVIYQLYAVVYHHGKSASGGHYTVAVRQHGTLNNWIHIDDTRIESIPANEVAVSVGNGRMNRDDGSDKGAYLLLYNLIKV